MTFHLFNILVNVNISSVRLLSKICLEQPAQIQKHKVALWEKKLHLWTAAPARLQEFITLRGKLNSLLIEKTEDLLHLAAHYYQEHSNKRSKAQPTQSSKILQNMFNKIVKYYPCYYVHGSLQSTKGIIVINELITDRDSAGSFFCQGQSAVS